MTRGAARIGHNKWGFVPQWQRCRNPCTGGPISTINYLPSLYICQKQFVVERRKHRATSYPYMYFLTNKAYPQIRLNSLPGSRRFRRAAWMPGGSVKCRMLSTAPKVCVAVVSTHKTLRSFSESLHDCVFTNRHGGKSWHGTHTVAHTNHELIMWLIGCAAALLPCWWARQPRKQGCCVVDKCRLCNGPEPVMRTSRQVPNGMMDAWLRWLILYTGYLAQHTVSQLRVNAGLTDTP